MYSVNHSSFYNFTVTNTTNNQGVYIHKSHNNTFFTTEVSFVDDDAFFIDESSFNTFTDSLGLALAGFINVWCESAFAEQQSFAR